MLKFIALSLLSTSAGALKPSHFQRLQRMPPSAKSAAAGASALLTPLAAFAEDAKVEAATSPDMFSWLGSKEAHDLGIYLAQTVISWGVPGAVVGAVGILIASAGRSDEPPPLPPALAKALGVSDEPKEFLQIEKMNEKLRSYEYSFAKVCDPDLQ